MGLLTSPPITLIKALSQGLVPSQIPHFLTLEFRIAKHRSGSNIMLKSITPELPRASSFFFFDITRLVFNVNIDQG